MQSRDLMLASNNVLSMTRTFDFAAHYFDSLETMSFCPQDYSHLKFGSDSVAKKFGWELADAFFEEHWGKLIHEQFVVIPSPYNYIKNAATVMAEHFTDRLNHLVINAGGQNVEWSTINRKVSYIQDYGFLTADKRKSLIDQDVFHLNKGYLEGKNLIFIDDVCITGTHENKLKEILEVNEMTNNRYFLYYAKFEDNGKASPDIEAAINFAGIKTVEDFVKLTEEPDHHMIVRPIKFLLGLDPITFDAFVRSVSPAFAQKLYFSSLAEGYHRIPSYALNLGYLSWYVGE